MQIARKGMQCRVRAQGLESGAYLLECFVYFVGRGHTEGERRWRPCGILRGNLGGYHVTAAVTA